MKQQNNYSFDSLNDRNLQSPGQAQMSHAEFLQSRKEIIMQKITSKQYKEAKLNESPTKSQKSFIQISSPEAQNQFTPESDLSNQQSPIKQQQINESSLPILKQVDLKKVQNVIVRNRNEANKAYSIQNFQNILREIGLIQNPNQSLDIRQQQTEIQQCEQLWRVIQFSCNSPFANQQQISAFLQIMLNRQSTKESVITLTQNELINNFKQCTQQNGEEFLKQLNYSNINLRDIINNYYEHIHSFELNEIVLYDQNSPIKNSMNIHKGNSNSNRHEKLFQHAQLLNQKRNTFSLLKQKEELDSCTFQPLVNRQVNITSPKYQKMLSSQVHNRLYDNAQEIKKREEETQFIKEREKEEEVQQYSFHPKINKFDATEMHNIDKRNINEYIPGARTQVERMAKARRIKTEKDEFWDKQMQQYREREVKVNPTKTQEFSFMNRNPLKKEPIMYLDVNITASKKGRIALYKGDDYKKVAKDFAKIYRLGTDALKELEERVQQAIHIYYSQFV